MLFLLCVYLTEAISSLLNVKFSATYSSSAKATELAQARPWGFSRPVTGPFAGDCLYH